jgi:hypothetical protein
VNYWQGRLERFPATPDPDRLPVRSFLRRRLHFSAFTGEQGSKVDLNPFGNKMAK